MRLLGDRESGSRRVLGSGFGAGGGWRGLFVGGYVLSGFDLEREPFGIRLECAEAEDDTPDDQIIGSGKSLTWGLDGLDHCPVALVVLEDDA